MLKDMAEVENNAANMEPSTPRRARPFAGTVDFYAGELEGSDDW